MLATKLSTSLLLYSSANYPSCCQAQIIHGLGTHVSGSWSPEKAAQRLRLELEDTTVASFHAITNPDEQQRVEEVLTLAGWTRTATFTNLGGYPLNVWFFENTNARNNVEDDDDY